MALDGGAHIRAAAGLIAGADTDDTPQASSRQC